MCFSLYAPIHQFRQEAQSVYQFLQKPTHNQIFFFFSLESLGGFGDSFISPSSFILPLSLCRNNIRKEKEQEGRENGPLKEETLDTASSGRKLSPSNGSAGGENSLS